ncbi:DUF302 domain-containing protein [Thiohalobacter sp.]|uniref:DUF302 domain-containing protein n=1 Tax=Thiohalobacter sp. TaxID=2025948 RepID=UPI0026385128|nr:DUF302 domain-containing protein [Thiohalobacter sp.]
MNLLRLILAGILMLAAGALAASELMMTRSPQPFAETMLALQEAIRERGYQLSRVQRVDVGLTTFGYQTDKYRVVFFGKPEQLRRLSAGHPELIPYLPLKVAIFAEADETLLVAADPREFERFYPAEDLVPVFEQWARDFEAIFDRLRELE